MNATKLSQREIARILGVTTRTIQNWTKAGLISGERFGRKRIYVLADVAKTCQQNHLDVDWKSLSEHTGTI